MQSVDYVPSSAAFTVSIVGRFSLASYGYLFARVERSSRYYSLYLTRFTKRLVMYYRIEGSTQQRSLLFESGINIVDGNLHAVTLVIVDATVTLHVDRTQYVHRVAGPVDECVDLPNATATCAFHIGQRAPSVFGLRSVRRCITVCTFEYCVPHNTGSVVVILGLSNCT